MTTARKPARTLPAATVRHTWPASAEEAASRLEQVLREVRKIELWSRRFSSGALAGGYASAFRGSGIEVHEIREYEEGDDPRTVDWNVTARTGRPFVKTFVEERDLTVLFLLDVSASMRAGKGRLSFAAAAARAIATLALSATASHDKVGLLAASSEIELFTPPMRGRDHALRVIRDALVCRPDHPGSDLSSGFEFLARGIRRRSVVFVVTDGFGTSSPTALSECARRHDVVVLRLLDATPGLSPIGPLRIRDPESDRILLVDSGAGQDGEPPEASSRRRMASLCRTASADLVEIRLPQGIDDRWLRPLYAYFQSRTQRGGK